MRAAVQFSGVKYLRWNLAHLTGGMMGRAYRYRIEHLESNRYGCYDSHNNIEGFIDD